MFPHHKHTPIVSSRVWPTVLSLELLPSLKNAICSQQTTIKEIR